MPAYAGSMYPQHDLKQMTTASAVQSAGLSSACAVPELCRRWRCTVVLVRLYIAFSAARSAFKAASRVKWQEPSRIARASRWGSLSKSWTSAHLPLCEAVAI